MGNEKINLSYLTIYFDFILYPVFNFLWWR